MRDSVCSWRLAAGSGRRLVINGAVPPVAARLPEHGRRWYRIENAAASEATVWIYDYIGFGGVEADAFVQDLEGVSAQTIHLRINSPGGSVFDGTAIYNALKRHPAHVVAHVDSLAASAASYIAMAGDEVRMEEGSFLMIHDPIGLAIGNAADMRQLADVLDKVRDEIAGIYSRKSGMDPAAVRQAMAEETWYTAQEARAAGLADAVASDDAPDNAPTTNRFDLSLFNHVPEQLAVGRGPLAAKPNQPTTKRDFEAFLRDAGGFSRAAAKALAAGGFDALDRRDAGAGAGNDRRDDDALAASIRAWRSCLNNCLDSYLRNQK